LDAMAVSSSIRENSIRRAAKAVRRKEIIF